MNQYKVSGMVTGGGRYVPPDPLGHEGYYEDSHIVTVLVADSQRQAKLLFQQVHPSADKIKVELLSEGIHPTAPKTHLYRISYDHHWGTRGARKISTWYVQSPTLSSKKAVEYVKKALCAGININALTVERIKMDCVYTSTEFH